MTLTLWLDEADVFTAAALLPQIRRQNEIATREGVIAGAVCVGLNRLCGAPAVVAALVGVFGIGLGAMPTRRPAQVELDVLERDEGRLGRAAEHYGVSVAEMASAAARTGLAMLSGVDTVRGAAARD